VVDVGRDDRAAASDFFAHELGRDDFRNTGAEAVPGMLLLEQAAGASFLKLHVFADGHVFHFWRDDAFARVVHLADVGAGLGPTRVLQVGKAQVGQVGVIQTFLAVA